VEPGDFYTVDDAAKILKLTPGRIRQMLRAGELAGDRDDTGRWRIPAHAVHDRPRPPRIERDADRPGSTGPEARESSERLQELESEVRDLRYQLGLSQGRLELTEKAESTLRESLERERERADRERERADQLQQELDQARIPWWRKLFGS
jgi:excisionase family DNA binding protein